MAQLIGWEFELPIRTVSVVNTREHWRRRAKRAQGERMAAKTQCPDFQLPCVVTLTRIAPRALDDDNLRPALKAIRDGIADRLGVNDRDPRVRWQYQQARGAPKQYAVRVRLAA